MYKTAHAVKRWLTNVRRLYRTERIAISPVPNGTARMASAAQTDAVSNATRRQSLSHVKRGDVLVSHATAVLEHENSVIPHAARSAGVQQQTPGA